MAHMQLQYLYNLNDQIALVTGGGTGIGFMIAQGLAANGAKVYITGRRMDVLEKAAASIGSNVIPLQMDVTDKASIAQGVNHIEEKHGKLHLLVNNAGQSGPVSLFFNDMSHPSHASAATLGRALFDNESFESWSSLYAVNTFHIFFVTTAFLGLLAAGTADRIHKGDEGYTASVVNITSISGLMKVAQDHFAYNSSKAAASHLTKLLSTEFALKGIPVRVNAVAPGVYASELTFPEIVGPEQTNMVAKCPAPVPAGRAGTAQEIAGAVLFLASRGGWYTNGHEIVVDGGAVAVNPSVV